MCFLLCACGGIQGGETDAAIDALDAHDASTDASNDVIVAADAGLDSVAPDASADVGACAYAQPGSYGCNSLLASPQVQVTCASTTTALGGVIYDGFYTLTNAVYDTKSFDAACPANLMRGGAIEVCAGTFLWLDIDQNNSSFDSTMKYSTNNNKITLTAHSGCDGNTMTLDYSSTSSTIELRGGSPTLVLTYTAASPDQ